MNIKSSSILFVILGSIFVFASVAVGPFGQSSPSDSTNINNNWTIKIDETTYNSSRFGVNSLITTLDKEPITITNANGVSQQVDRCPIFPSIEVSNTINVSSNRESAIVLRYDGNDCSVSIIEQSSNSTNYIPNRSMSSVRADGEQLIHGYALAELKAKDVIQFGLTQTETRMLVDADSLVKHSYNNDCDADGPAGAFANWSIDWYTDACRSTPFTRTRNYVVGATEGDYHAEFGGNVTVTGDSTHTSSARLKLTSNRATVTCIWNPADIEDFVVQIDPWGPLGPYNLGVTTRCHNGTLWVDAE